MPAKVRSTQLFTELYSADELHCRLMCTLSGSPGASFTLKLANAQIPECLRNTKAFTRASNASTAESRSMAGNCNVQSVPAGRHGRRPSIGSRRSHHEATPATRTSMHCFSFHPGPRTCPPPRFKKSVLMNFLVGRSNLQITYIHFVATFVHIVVAGGGMADKVQRRKRYIDERTDG